MNKLSSLACDGGAGAPSFPSSAHPGLTISSFQLGPFLAGWLAVAALADKGPSPSQSYGAPQDSYQPQVKYGGPIVYSGEKPPIIHFPPPPEVSGPSD